MNGISVVNTVLTNTLSANLEQANKMTTLAVAAGTNQASDEVRASVMQMFGIGGAINELA